MIQEAKKDRIHRGSGSTTLVLGQADHVGLWYPPRAVWDGRPPLRRYDTRRPGAAPP